MFRIFKYLKPYTVAIIILIILVAVEVKSELALPECVGDMVSGGIEQTGIDNYIPVIINKKTRENILSLTPKEKKQLVLKSYKKLDTKSQLKNNKKLKNMEIDFKNNDLYIMSNTDKKDLETLDENLFNVFSIISCEKSNNIKNMIIKDTGLVSQETIIFQINNLNNLNNQAGFLKEKILKLVNNNIKKIEKTKLSSLILKNMKDDYNKINLDIKILQKNYIKDKSKQMIIYILLADISWIFIMFITAICSSGVARNLKRDLFKSVIEFSKLEIDKFSVSSLITRTTNDVNQIQNFIFYFLENMFFSPIYGIVAFKKAYEKNVEMSWIILFVIIIMLILTVVILFLVVPKFNLVQKLVDKINLITRENLTGLLSIRVFNTQKLEEKRFEESNYQFKKTKWFIERVMALINPLIFLVINISTVVVVWVSYKYILNSTLQVGDIIVYINYMMGVISSFLMMSMMFIEFPRASVSAKRIFEVLKTNPYIEDPDMKNNFDDKCEFKGELTFKNVNFSYPGASEYVLRDISFVARPGQTTAIIGSTGSGKSTLINLISRFYDVNSGEILIDGINIKNISQKKLREQISYVPQKGVLFKGTIESNIKYGNDKATNKEIKEVVEVSQAQDFIDKKSKKFLSEISQGGDNVSGGQRQRLSIARALLKKSRVYIFDDSFSALDFKTDFELRKALYSYIKQATIIIVAQRVNTVINADQIIVLDKGKIVGKGSHKELLESCKEYYEIASNQLPKDLLN